MQAEGTAIGEARDKIWMMDIDGLLARGRPEGRLEGMLKSTLPIYALVIR